MAAPTVRSAATSASAASSTSHVVTAPGTITDGDSVIVFFGWVGNASHNSLPSGFALITGSAQGGSGSTSARVEAYIKHSATAAEAGGTYTFGSPSSRNWAAVAIACEPLKSGQYVVSGGTQGASSPITTPTITAIGETLTVAGVVGVRTGTTTAYTEDKWTERADLSTGNTGTSPQGYQFGAVTDSNGVAGSIVGATFTHSGGSTAGTWPKLTMGFISASANVLPSVSVTTDEVLGQVGRQVTLGPALGTDPDGTIASYLWTQDTSLGTQLTAPALSGSTTDTATFTPTAPGAYTYQVVAIDNSGGTSSPATVSVTVVNTPVMKIRSGGTWVQHKTSSRASGAFA